MVRAIVAHFAAAHNPRRSGVAEILAVAAHLAQAFEHKGEVARFVDGIEYLRVQDEEGEASYS